MTPKGANLNATDLIEVSTIESGSYVTRSLTGQEIIDGIPPAAAAWGSITGTLSTQTDLQNALDAKVPTSRTLTINGVTQDLSANRTFTVSTGITIGSTAIASGVVGRVLFEGTGNVVQESSGLTWDDTNKQFVVSGNQNNTTFLTISNTTAGTSSNSSLQLISDASAGQAQVFKYSSTRSSYKTLAPNDFGHYNATAGDISFLNDVPSGKIKFATNQSNTPQMTLASTGNVLIGTTTDAGFKLDVNGTARVQSTLDINTGSGIAATGVNNPIVINSNYWANGDGLVIASKNTSDSSPKLTLRSNSAGSCSLQLYNNGSKSYIRQINTSGVGAQSVYLFQIDNRAAKLAVTNDDSTTDASFFGKAIWDGGAAATFRASSATQTANVFNVQNHDGTTTFLNVKPSGNVLINTTTDAGFKLDVNGTARVSGTLKLSNNITTSTQNGYFEGNTAGNITNTTAVFNFQHPTNATSGTMFQFSDNLNTGYVTDLYGNKDIVRVYGGFKNPNSAWIYSDIKIDPTYQGVGNGVIVRGIYYNPTNSLTGTYTHRAIETTTGDVIFGTTSGNVMIGTTTNIASSKLTIESTTRGFLPPRMTTAQKNAIATPATGLQVYDTTLNQISYYNGTTWTNI